MNACEARIEVEGPYPECPGKAMVRLSCQVCGLRRNEPVFDVDGVDSRLIAARANNRTFTQRPIFPTFPIDEFGRGIKCEQGGVVEEVPTEVRKVEFDLQSICGAILK